MNLLKLSTLLTVSYFSVMGVANGHQMFLKPEKHSYPAPVKTTIELVNGTYDQSENTIARKRMADVSVVSNDKIDKPLMSDWYERENSTMLPVRLNEPGTHLIGLSTKASFIGMTANEFVDYLIHDGLKDTHKSFNKANYPNKVNERYAKHVKSLVQVGDVLTQDYAKELGYPVEIIPLVNPFALAVGDNFSFKVTYLGKPVADQLVYVGVLQHGSGESKVQEELRTNDQGIASFKLTEKANWYIQLIHMQKLSQGKIDYQSDWSTLTFAN